MVQGATKLLVIIIRYLLYHRAFLNTQITVCFFTITILHSDHIKTKKTYKLRPPQYNICLTLIL